MGCLALPIILCLAAWSANAASEQLGGEHQLKVSVREVWSTYGDPGFATPRGMAQWPDGTVWIGDNRLSEVSEVSADGTSVRVVLREGEGPREVDRVHHIDTFDRGGAVILGGSRVHFYRANKRLRRRGPDNPVWKWGFATTSDGGYVISGGYGIVETHELARFSVHRYDGRGRHVTSWHPVADHDDWETRRSASGGPLAITRDGGLLVSEAAPFRITRYADLEGNGARLIIEDEGILSSSELDRAVTRGPGSRISYTNAWSKSVYVGEMEDGNILNVAVFYPEEEDARAWSSWMVVSPNGEVMAHTRVTKGYHVWNDAPGGHYLATYWDHETSQSAAVKLEVTIEAGEQ